MDTNTLRDKNRAEAERMGGRVWPNGIGFDLRRWEYCYNAGAWYALNRHTTGNSKHGKGTTPEEARKNARPMEY